LLFSLVFLCTASRKEHAAGGGSLPGHENAPQDVPERQHDGVRWNNLRCRRRAATKKMHAGSWPNARAALT
jgi:hypothetical protein